jgi:hypothetical protein
MKVQSSILAATLAAALTSCLVPPSNAPARASVPYGPPETDPWSANNERKQLYARDGSPVPNKPAASVTTADAIGRDLGAKEGSRPYLLELYQQAIEQKEALALEVSALHAALEEADHRQLELETDNEGLKQRIRQIEQRVTALEADKLDLAGRLATAQIRRLEAEKLLLETTLEWSRFQSSRAGSGASPAAGEAGE